MQCGITEAAAKVDKNRKKYGNIQQYCMTPYRSNEITHQENMDNKNSLAECTNKLTGLLTALFIRFSDTSI